MPEGVIYLDGNSLGPLPKSVSERLTQVIQDEWGRELIKGWNTAGWMVQPSDVGNSLGRLIGAPEGTVATGDTLSIKVFQALSAGIAMRPERRVILSDTGNFPSDLYMAEGLIELKESGYELRLVDPDQVIAAIDETVAVVMLTQVDYRTGRMHEMEVVTKAAHSAGAVMLWDLAHSAGAIEVDLKRSHAELAVGCTYKYLNGGPGAPAFIYIRPDLTQSIKPALAGWLGHDAPFAFEPAYRPAPGIERMRVGTPPVLQMAALEEALRAWDGIDMADVRRVSVNLTETFIAEVEARCPDLKLVSPRDPAQRGSQVSFAFQDGYAVMQALIAKGVIGDFRAPNIMRFGFAPLYIDKADVMLAVDVLEEILKTRSWDTPAFKRRNRVT